MELACSCDSLRSCMISHVWTTSTINPRADHESCQLDSCFLCKWTKVSLVSFGFRGQFVPLTFYLDGIKKDDPRVNIVCTCTLNEDIEKVLHKLDLHYNNPEARLAGLRDGVKCQHILSPCSTASNFIWIYVIDELQLSIRYRGIDLSSDRLPVINMRHRALGPCLRAGLSGGSETVHNCMFDLFCESWQCTRRFHVNGHQWIPQHPTAPDSNSIQMTRCVNLCTTPSDGKRTCQTGWEQSRLSKKQSLVSSHLIY